MLFWFCFFLSFLFCATHFGHHDSKEQSLSERLEELEIRGRTETIKTTALLRSARILRRVGEI